MHQLKVLIIVVLSVCIGSSAKASRTLPFPWYLEITPSGSSYPSVNSLKQADIISHNATQPEKDDTSYQGASVLTPLQSFLDRAQFIPLMPPSLADKTNTYKENLELHPQQQFLYVEKHDKPYSSCRYSEQMLVYLKPRLEQLLQIPDPCSTQGKFLSLEAIAEFFRTEALIYNRDFMPTPDELLSEIILKDKDLKKLYEKTNINR